MLYRIILMSAMFPLGIAVILFLCWYIPRSFYASDYPLLEQAGVYCYILFLAGLLMAAVLLLVWCVQSKVLFHPKVLFLVAVLSLSYFFGQKLLAFGLAQKEKAFVRIDNRSGQNLTCNLHPYFANRIKQFLLKNGTHKMFIYQPEYDVVDDERDLRLKEAHLDIRKGEQRINITLPPIDKGSCRTFVLDQDLKLKNDE